MRVASCFGPKTRRQKFTIVKFVISSLESSLGEEGEEEEKWIPMIPKKDKRRTISRPMTFSSSKDLIWNVDGRIKSVSESYLGNRCRGQGTILKI